MARTFRGRWGISGPQAGYGTTSKARKPGGRVTKEGLFPETGGHVLSLDEEDSKYRKSAKTGAARIERMTAAEKRKMGIPSGGGEAEDDSEDDDSGEEEVEVEEDEDELDSDDLEDYETPKEKRKKRNTDLFELAAEKVKEAEQAEESEAARRRRMMAEAALKRTQSKEVLVIDIDTTADSGNEEEGAKDQEELEEWLRTSNAPPHIRKQLLATLKKSSPASESQPASKGKGKAKSTSKTQPKPKSKSGKRLLLSSSDSESDSDQPVASSSKRKIPSPPPPKRGKKSGNSKAKDDDDRLTSRTYGAAAKLAVPRSLVRAEEFEDSDEEREANAYKSREKTFQIHVPDDDEEDRRFIKENKKYEKLEKVTRTKKRKFKEARGAGYSNPRRN